MSITAHWELVWTGSLSQAEPDLDSTAEDRALIAASKRGDRPAFEALIKRYEHRVFRLASRFFRRREEIEDVAQETFLTVWRKLDTYRERAPFEHWLTRVCLNCCYARFRKRRPEETHGELPEIAVRGDDADSRIDAERLLAGLDPKDRFVLQMLHGEGWTVAEISDRLGWSRSKVKVRAHRARGKLRNLLSKEVREHEL